MIVTRRDEAREQPERRRDPLNPFQGRPGVFNRIASVAFRFTGPAAVGIGRKEEPYQPLVDPSCPLCGAPMSGHTIDRSGPRPQLYCPPQAV
jgi:hypothetical protein